MYQPPLQARWCCGPACTSAGGAAPILMPRSGPGGTADLCMPPLGATMAHSVHASAWGGLRGQAWPVLACPLRTRQCNKPAHASARGATAACPDCPLWAGWWGGPASASAGVAAPSSRLMSLWRKSPHPSPPTNSCAYAACWMVVTRTPLGPISN